MVLKSKSPTKDSGEVREWVQFFVCKYCGYRCNSTQLAHRHVSKYRKEDLVKCAYSTCNFHSKCMYEIRTHERIVHGKRQKIKRSLCLQYQNENLSSRQCGGREFLFASSVTKTLKKKPQRSGIAQNLKKTHSLNPKIPISKTKDSRKSECRKKIQMRHPVSQVRKQQLRKAQSRQLASSNKKSILPLKNSEERRHSLVPEESPGILLPSHGRNRKSVSGQPNLTVVKPRREEAELHKRDPKNGNHRFDLGSNNSCNFCLYVENLAGFVKQWLGSCPVCHSSVYAERKSPMMDSKSMFACNLCDLVANSEISLLKHSCSHKQVAISLERL